jgi:hypothetical protein
MGNRIVGRVERVSETRHSGAVDGKTSGLAETLYPTYKWKSAP